MAQHVLTTPLTRPVLRALAVGAAACCAGLLLPAQPRFVAYVGIGLFAALLVVSVACAARLGAASGDAALQTVWPGRSLVHRLRRDLAAADALLGPDVVFAPRVRDRAREDLGALRVRLRLLLRQTRRGRVAWAFGDHGPWCLAAAALLGATLGLADLHPGLGALVLALAAATGEVLYRGQRRLRYAVAREVRVRSAELLSRCQPQAPDRRRLHPVQPALG